MSSTPRTTLTMEPDPGSFAGLLAVALLAGLSIAAWFAGRRRQRAEDEAHAARAAAAGARAGGDVVEAAHVEAAERLSASELREHNDDLARRILDADDS